MDSNVTATEDYASQKLSHKPRRLFTIKNLRQLTRVIDHRCPRYAIFHRDGAAQNLLVGSRWTPYDTEIKTINMRKCK